MLGLAVTSILKEPGILNIAPRNRHTFQETVDGYSRGLWHLVFALKVKQLLDFLFKEKNKVISLMLNARV